MIFNPRITEIIRNSSDVTTSYVPYLQGVTFEDRLGGNASTLSLDFLRVQGQAVFARGDAVKVKFSGGTAGNILDTGTMVVDRIDSSFMPNVQTIGCQSYDYALGMAGKTDIAYQGSTLRNIVSTQAAFPNPDLTVPELTSIVNEVAGAASTDGGTDNKESAESRLALLQNLAVKYGYVFQMRSGILTFRPYENVEGDAAVATLALTDCEPGADFEDNEAQSIRTVYVEHSGAGFVNQFDPSSPTTDLLDLRNEGFYANATIAGRRAYGAIKEKNNNRRVGRLTVWGNALLIAGKNVTLDSSFWEWAGKWNITRATHRLTPNSGWRTALEIRGINV